MKRAKQNKPIDLNTPDADALLISVQTAKGVEAFITAGAEILRSEYNFTYEQAAAWATKTLQAGGKYLKQGTAKKTIYASKRSL